MLCPSCNRRKARRECPALGRAICPICCGTKRLVEIQCPSNCAYLASAREHPAAVVRRQQERDVARTACQRSVTSRNASTSCSSCFIRSSRAPPRRVCTPRGRRRRRRRGRDGGDARDRGARRNLRAHAAITPGKVAERGAEDAARGRCESRVRRCTTARWRSCCARSSRERETLRAPDDERDGLPRFDGPTAANHLDAESPSHRVSDRAGAATLVLSLKLLESCNFRIAHERLETPWQSGARSAVKDRWSARTVSHAHNVGPRRFEPNLQTVRAARQRRDQADPRLHALPALRQGHQGGLTCGRHSRA